MLKINPLFDKIESNNKLYYLRMSFKQYYPSIYERLTYAVVKDEEVNIIKQIIEFYYLFNDIHFLKIIIFKRRGN